MGAGNGGMPFNPMYNFMYMNQLFNLYQKMLLHYNFLLMQKNNNNSNDVNSFGMKGGNPNMIPETIIPKNVQFSCDPFPNDFGPKINIFFVTGNNTRIIMYVPVNTPMKDIFKAFVKKLVLPEDTLGRYIYFLFNGLLVSHKEKKTAFQIGIKYDLCQIIVLDTKNLIAGKD